MKRYLTAVVIGSILLTLPLAFIKANAEPLAKQVTKAPTVSTAVKSESCDQIVSKAEFVTMLVKDANLNLEKFRFVKEPQISDLYSDVNSNQVYAKDIMLVSLNNILVGENKTFQPDIPVTRNIVASAMVKTLEVKGIEINPFTKKDNQDDLYTAYSFGILPLQEDLKNGDGPLKLAELQKIFDNFDAILDFSMSDKNAQGIKYQLTPSVDGISQLTLFWGEKSSSGYSIEITNLVIKNNILYVGYKTTEPQLGAAYACVITNPNVTRNIETKEMPKRVVLIKE